MSAQDPDHERVCEIFHEVADLEGDEREQLLTTLCEGNPELRAKVAALLACDARQSDSLDTGAFVRQHAADLNDLEGVEIGPYRILERLGEGGMGVVYRAEQQRPVRRQVALKLLRHAVAAKEIIDRFGVEGQLLATMNHPNIAHMYEVGTLDSGQPFFAMEFVDGAPITEFCDEQRLTVDLRLKLFLQVCEGVEHAHRKAVVHRDLKPSNVLVTSVDGKPLVKVIDFGIAKPLDPQLVDNPMRTLGSALVGTPEYMSPEQVAPDGEVGPRSDVYSLGVMLYELLAGRRPIEGLERRGGTVAGIQRLIEEEIPALPSRPSRDAKQRWNEVAQQRQTDASGLTRRLRGDLDWITMRAIAKEPELRYPSAVELAADVRRHLEGRAVEAGPPTMFYRASKFVRRHRMSVTLGLVLMVVSLLVIAAVYFQTGKVGEERTRQVTTVLRDIAQAERSIRPVERLNDVAAEIDGSAMASAEDRANLLQALGSSYLNLEEVDLALPRLQQASELYEDALGPGHESSLRSALIWAGALRAKGWYTKAASIWRRTMDRGTRSLGTNHPMTLEAIQGLANTIIELGRWHEAEALHRVALQGWTETTEADSRRVVSSRNRLGEILILQGRLDEAERYLSDERSRREGDSNRRAVSIGRLHRMAMLRLAQGRLDEAESMFRERLRLIGDLFGINARERSSVIFERARMDLAMVLSRQGRHEESERLMLDSVNVLRERLRESHPRLLIAKAKLADVQAAAGRRATAVELYRELLGHWLGAVDAEEPVVLQTRNRIGELLVAIERYDEAESAFRTVLQLPADASPDQAREREFARIRLEELGRRSKDAL